LRGKFSASMAAAGAWSEPAGTASALWVGMRFFWRAAIWLAFIFSGVTHWAAADPFPVRGPTVPGRFAQLRHGVACAPEKAPLPVKRAIWAANQLRKLPYCYGGGHGSFFDRGYDCSGTVSYALGAAGLLRTPLSSNELTRYGTRGRGKWITIYARNGHAFAVIAGLRLDTTAWNGRTDREAPRWQLTSRPPQGFAPRHPAGL
jgi:hypothetical protein